MRRSSVVRTVAFAAVAALVLAACGSPATTPAAPASPTGSPEPLGGTLVVSNWDAYMPKSLIKSFEEDTGVDVQLAIHTTNEDIMGKVTAANGEGFDVVFVSGPFVQQLVGLGYASELDHSQIPNFANLYPQANELGYDPGNVHSAPYAWGTTGICYRTDLVDQKPTSWEVFRSPLPGTEGKMTMLGTDRWLLQPGLLSLGYSINTAEPSEVDAAKQWTLEAKENLLAFDDTTFYSKLASGEASLVQAWDGWCNYGLLENPNIDFIVPSEGSDVWTDTMVVLESSENKAAAHAFIDHVLSEQVGASVAGFTLYKVPNQPAMESLDPALIEDFPSLGISPEELLQQTAELDLGEDGTILWTETATEIKAG